MRAAVFRQPESCVIVEQETIGPSETHVLVKVECCGVCGTDSHIYRGGFPAQYPVIAGHEFAGVVEEVGAEVPFLRTGDHVTIDPNIFCGSCRPCRRGLTHLCSNLSAIGVTQDGGFATHCVLPGRQCHKLPPELELEVAAMAEPVACCIHGIDRAGVDSGDVVVIIGAGTIGLILLQLAMLRGAATTIVSEPQPEKRARAQTLGAARVVDPQREDLEQIARNATEGAGPDVVIECVGGANTAQQAVDLAGVGGRVLLFGVAGENERIHVSPYDIYRREVSITGSFTNPFTHDRAIALLASGRLQVKDLISHRLPLDGVPEGIGLLESGKATKVMVHTQE
ncbi:MAG: zinc-dependent alcohol dehydrogenase family protein [Armatimonadetes bacterium]|nr:zinc-dependent alcohol dehydrogenase family protein [Armatimonadota bacterium]